MVNIIPAASRRDVLKVSALSSITGLLGATRTLLSQRVRR